MGKIGIYNPDTGKVEWHEKDRSLMPSVAPAIEGVKEIRAVGLPGQPTFSSRKSYERAVRDAGCVVVGNDPQGMSKRMRDSGIKDRRHGGHNAN